MILGITIEQPATGLKWWCYYAPKGEFETQVSKVLQANNGGGLYYMQLIIDDTVEDVMEIDINAYWDRIAVSRWFHRLRKAATNYNFGPWEITRIKTNKEV